MSARGAYESLEEHLELDTRWMADAGCVQIPGLPWIDNPQRTPHFVRGLMAEVCAACPVLERCESFVEEAGITAGFWAGRLRSRRHLIAGRVGDEAA